MAIPHSFPQAAFLAQLEHRDGGMPVALPGLAPLFVADASGQWQHSELGTALLRLLQARRTLFQSAADTTLMADELRRYQKFSPPGRPSMQLVQLRRQQASVQQAARMARQAFIRTADAFVRVAALQVPAKLGLIAFIERWLDTQIPDTGAASTSPD